jgi:hypothetical protein
MITNNRNTGIKALDAVFIAFDQPGLFFNNTIFAAGKSINGDGLLKCTFKYVQKRSNQSVFDCQWGIGCISNTEKLKRGRCTAKPIAVIN